MLKGVANKGIVVETSLNRLLYVDRGSLERMLKKEVIRQQSPHIEIVSKGNDILPPASGLWCLISYDGCNRELRLIAVEKILRTCD